MLHFLKFIPVARYQNHSGRFVGKGIYNLPLGMSYVMAHLYPERPLSWIVVFFSELNISIKNWTFLCFSSFHNKLYNSFSEILIHLTHQLIFVYLCVLHILSFFKFSQLTLCEAIVNTHFKMR